jgi:hypothetical protein
MHCFKNARSVSASVRTGAALLAALLAWSGVATAQGRGGDERQDNMRMPGVSIEGERQTPDIFFVFPTGKGGNLSAPKFRDYGPDILEPVVKPWFERDQMVMRAQVQAASTRTFDWDEALKSSPAAPAPPAAPAVAAPVAPPPLPPPSMPNPALPPPSIPSQALSLPRSAPNSEMPPPEMPAQAMPAAPSRPVSQPLYPPGSRPLPAELPPGYRPSDSDGVPVLVPPQ